MKKIFVILSLVFASHIWAVEPQICKPDFRACKPPAVKINGRCTIVKEKECSPPIVETKVVEKEVIVEKIVEKVIVKETVNTVIQVEKSPWEIMAFARFGIHWNTNGYPSNYQTQTDLNGVFNNWGSWDVGTEFHFTPLRLGLRTSIGNNGIDGLFQFFPMQGRLSWYVGAGMAYTQYPFYRPTVPYVQRYFDFRLGTGVEYAFTKHVIGLADLRAGFPIPWTNTAPLTWNDVGRSLTETALMLGVGYRF